MPPVETAGFMVLIKSFSKRGLGLTININYVI